MELKDKIKKYRLDNHLTQEQFAKQLFVSRSSVAKWEQGRSIPSLDLLLEFAKMSHTTIDELINSGEEKRIILQNNQALVRLGNIFKGTIITIILFILCGSIGLGYHFINKNKDQPHIIPTTIYGKVVQCDELFSYIDMSSQKTTFKKAELKHVSFYDRNQESINYSTIKVGYYISLEYLDVVLSVENILEIKIIDDNPSHYEIYGFFISLDDEDLDELPDFNDHIPVTDNYGVAKSFKYPFYKEELNKTSWSHFITIDSKESFLNENNTINHKKVDFTVKITNTKTNNTKIYIIDNSEKGFALFHDIKSKGYVATIKGYQMNPSYSEQRYDLSKGYQVTYNIKIMKADCPKMVNVYAYNKNFSLIKELSFIDFLDFDPLYPFYLPEETLFVIIKEEFLYSSSKTVFYYLNDDYNFIVDNGFGFIYSGTVKLRIK